MQCVLVHADGRVTPRRLWQRDAHTCLGGAVALVGAVDEERAFAVALRQEEEATRLLAVNGACTDPARFHVLPVRGPVLFVGTDADGAETDLDVASLSARLGLTPRPEAAHAPSAPVRTERAPASCPGRDATTPRT